MLSREFHQLHADHMSAEIPPLSGHCVFCANDSNGTEAFHSDRQFPPAFPPSREFRSQWSGNSSPFGRFALVRGGAADGGGNGGDSCSLLGDSSASHVRVSLAGVGGSFAAGTRAKFGCDLFVVHWEGACVFPPLFLGSVAIVGVGFRVCDDE